MYNLYAMKLPVTIDIYIGINVYIVDVDRKQLKLLYK